MAEHLIGIIKNAQAKGRNSILIKSCDLYVTNKRLICVVVGNSAMVSGMIGQALNGVVGAITWSQTTILKNNNQRTKNIEKTLDEIIKDNPESYAIVLNQINPDKSTLKTGFFSTLGLWAPLTIWTSNKKKFFFNIPYNARKIATTILNLATQRIKIK